MQNICILMNGAMADSLPSSVGVKDNKLWKGVFAVTGIMSTLVIYGVLQVIIAHLLFDCFVFLF